MSKNKFDDNIALCRNLFLEVLSTNDDRINFLYNTLIDNDYISKLDKDHYDKIQKALDTLVENARVDEMRKYQQAHFGPLLGKLRTQDAKDLSNIFKNDQNAFIDYLQLLSIFFFRKEMESENHSHESIREALSEKSNNILKELKG
ncbi:MAG: hypothetical protein ACRC8C_01425 [Mycoplasmoidaceae bacterium]